MHSRLYIFQFFFGKIASFLEIASFSDVDGNISNQALPWQLYNSGKAAIFGTKFVYASCRFCVCMESKILDEGKEGRESFSAVY